MKWRPSSRWNVNLAPSGGHILPVNHMYLDYVTPRNGGTHRFEVDAMAAGRIVALLQRKTEVQGVGPVDEYEVWIQHTDHVTSYYDHLHELEARLPDWHDPAAGWVDIGPNRILFLGLNGARDPVHVRPGQRLGWTRNYFTSWDIGVVDTRHVGSFLGSGLLRYPSLPEFFAQYISEGGHVPPLGPDQPFPGEMFVNSGCFIDYMTPALAAQWRAKLVGDGSGGRPDWDREGTLLGTWYRAEVTSVTFENMMAAEANAISFSPYNRDRQIKCRSGSGRSLSPAGLRPLRPYPSRCARSRPIGWRGRSRSHRTDAGKPAEPGSGGRGGGRLRVLRHTVSRVWRRDSPAARLPPQRRWR